MHLYTVILYYMHYMHVISFVPKSMSYTYQCICTINLYIYSTKTTTLPQDNPWVWQGRRRAYRPTCPPNHRGRQVIVHNIICTYFVYIHEYYILYSSVRTFTIIQYSYRVNHHVYSPLFFFFSKEIILKFWDLEL